MATNKNALIRYRTIDKCLQNDTRKWTLQDLINACSDALYEYEGKDTMVSKRTVQLDIQMMRSNKLGYNAPIICYARKYYKYEDEEYSITDIPLTRLDLDVLTESVEMLSQFKDFSLFSEMNGIIQKLEDKIYRESRSKAPIIHIEKNEELKGLEHLDTLYQAILKKIVLRLTYQSFSARRESEIIFHPYILKEFNNRWFVVGKVHDQPKILNLALDRLISINFDLSITYSNDDFDGNDYYKDTYGVTVLTENEIINVVFTADRTNAPYISTKPLHHSQQVVENHKDGSVTFSLNVHHNYELERLLLGFGESVIIQKPRRLRSRIKKKLKNALGNYDR